MVQSVVVSFWVRKSIFTQNVINSYTVHVTKLVKSGENVNMYKHTHKIHKC